MSNAASGVTVNVPGLSLRGTVPRARAYFASDISCAHQTTLNTAFAVVQKAWPNGRPGGGRLGGGRQLAGQAFSRAGGRFESAQLGRRPGLRRHPSGRRDRPECRPPVRGACLRYVHVYSVERARGRCRRRPTFGRQEAPA